MKTNELRCFNIWYKRLRLALELDRAQVIKIMELGGETVTRSHVDGWKLNDKDDRYRAMTMKEFDSFTFGLVEFRKSNLHD